MKEIIMYEAFDGERFHERKKCEKYENVFSHFNDYIRFYNKNMEQIPVDPIERNYGVLDAYDRSTYIRILPSEGHERDVHFLIDYYGMCIDGFVPGPQENIGYYKAGLYEYTGDDFELVDG